jgi:hypothetical protein
MLEAYSAVSLRKDAYDAGRQAMETAMGRLSGTPDIIWAFGAISFDQRKLLKGIRSIAQDVPLVGCTTDGEISMAGLTTDSVAVMAVRSDRLKFKVVTDDSLSKGAFPAGVNVGRALQGTGCRYVQLFSDGLTGNATRIIEGVRQELGSDIVVAGGTAGDGGKFTRTYQYCNDRPLTDSVVAVGFMGDFHFGTGVKSGWIPFGMAKQVTRSEGNVVYELDGQPALQVYERFLGKYASCLPAVGVEYPLALLESNNHVDENDTFVCRATMGVDRERGSITFAGDVPVGSLVKMTMGNDQDVIQAAKTAAEDALCELEASRKAAVPKMAFVFSCMARKIVLGSRIVDELQQVKQVMGEDIPMVGFYTYGEYAPIGKDRVSCFHNETITLTLLGE